MNWLFTVFIFIASCLVLSWLSSRLIKSLIKVARYLGWREFVIAFFVMSFAVSLPNLFVGLNAALQGKPEIALGDIIGGNLIDLTLVLGIAVFFSRKKGLMAESRMVQQSAIITAAIAVLPLLLIADKAVSRMDGLVLIGAFIMYAWWVFSKTDRFKKVYNGVNHASPANFKKFLLNLGGIILFLVLLLLASQAVIMSAQAFSSKLGISLALVSILIVAMGNCFPELYFSIISARKNHNYLVLGDLMGSVIVCATLVLGIVALAAPFAIADFSPFLIARIFLIVAAALSLLFIRSHRRISKKEGLLLLLVYIVFLMVEVFMSY